MRYFIAGVVCICLMPFCENRADTESQSSLDKNEITLDSSDYRNRFFIDTTFPRGNNQFKLELSLDFDSSKKIVVPQKYVDMYGLTNFQVYESFSVVRIYKDKLLVKDTTLYKTTYRTEIDSSLSEYGNLMFPGIRIFDKQIEIIHSLSIPMTDVGVPVSSKIILD